MDAIRQVLIVEDLPDVAQWLHGQVASLLSPTQIDQAGTLAQARDKIDAHAYDLALIDLGLPDGNGVGLIRPLCLSGGRICYPSATAGGQPVFDLRP